MYSSDILKRGRLSITEYYNMPEFSMTETHITETQAEETGKSSLESVTLNPKASEEMIKKAHLDARRIITEAQQRAELICEKAKKDAETQRQEALKEAFEEGYKEGLSQGKAEAEASEKNIIDELLELSYCLTNEKREIAEKSQNLILELAAEIARKVVGDCFVRQEEVFSSMFHKAVKDMPSAQKLTVTVADKDYQIMSYEPQKVLEQCEEFKCIELCRDKNATEGTLKLETAVMLLDAGINTQIGMLKKEIAKTL